MTEDPKIFICCLELCDRTIKTGVLPSTVSCLREKWHFYAVKHLCPFEKCLHNSALIAWWRLSRKKEEKKKKGFVFRAILKQQIVSESKPRRLKFHEETKSGSLRQQVARSSEGGKQQRYKNFCVSGQKDAGCEGESTSIPQENRRHPEIRAGTGPAHRGGTVVPHVTHVTSTRSNGRSEPASLIWEASSVPKRLVLPSWAVDSQKGREVLVPCPSFVLRFLTTNHHSKCAWIPVAFWASDSQHRRLKLWVSLRGSESRMAARGVSCQY